MSTEAPAVTKPHRRRSAVVDLSLIAVGAAMICVLGPLSVGGPVPGTLQTFAIVLIGLLLGPTRAVAATGIYLLVGLLGAPVFAGGGSGVAAFVGPSGGFLLSFPLEALIAGLTGLLVVRHAGARLRPWLFAAGGAIAAFSVFPLGVALFAARFTPEGAAVAGVDLRTALSFALAPFVVADLIKVAFAALVATGVHRAYPRLLER